MPGIRVLVPYDASPAAKRALDVALQLSAAADRKQSVVHPAFVVEVDRALPLDALIPELSAHAEECLSEADTTAAKAKIKSDSCLLQSRQAGPGIVEQAVSARVDLVVIGVDTATSVDGADHARTAHSRYSAAAIDLGPTADYVISHVPCEVIVVRNRAAAPGGAA